MTQSVVAHTRLSEGRWLCPDQAQHVAWAPVPKEAQFSFKVHGDRSKVQLGMMLELAQSLSSQGISLPDSYGCDLIYCILLFLITPSQSAAYNSPASLTVLFF